MPLVSTPSLSLFRTHLQRCAPVIVKSVRGYIGIELSLWFASQVFRRYRNWNPVCLYLLWLRIKPGQLWRYGAGFLTLLSFSVKSAVPVPITPSVKLLPRLSDEERRMLRISLL